MSLIAGRVVEVEFGEKLLKLVGIHLAVIDQPRYASSSFLDQLDCTMNDRVADEPLAGKASIFAECPAGLALAMQGYERSRLQVLPLRIGSIAARAFFSPGARPGPNPSHR